MSELRSAALQLAAKGKPIFPCRVRGKEPLTPNGVKDATCDHPVVLSWWGRHPEANIGLATGPTSGLLVVDLDGEEGLRSWAQLEAEHGPVLTLEQATANGVHLFMRYPDETALGNSAGRLGPGIDTRAKGGYVLCAPSVHPSGHRYTWVDKAIPPAPCPDWLVRLLTEPAPRPAPPRIAARPSDDARLLARFDGLLDLVAEAAEGTRNARLHWASCRLAELIGEGAPEAWAAILEDAGVAAGLAPGEVRRTVASGLGRVAS